jgi:hypothetical protein
MAGGTNPQRGIMTSNHRSLQTSSTTLPTSTGDRAHEIEFDAPNLSSTTSTHARPYLSYRVNPGSETVRVQVLLNDVEIADQTIDSTVSRQFNEIFDHGVLEAADNTLRFFVPNNEPGSVTISDVIAVYTGA